jgi:hypothetical protein
MHEGKENPPRRRAPREEAKGPRAATRKIGVFAELDFRRLRKKDARSYAHK